MSKRKEEARAIDVLVRALALILLLGGVGVLHAVTTDLTVTPYPGMFQFLGITLIIIGAFFLLVRLKGD